MELITRFFRGKEKQSSRKRSVAESLAIVPDLAQIGDPEILSREIRKQLEAVNRLQWGAPGTVDGSTFEIAHGSFFQNFTHYLSTLRAQEGFSARFEGIIDERARKEHARAQGEGSQGYLRYSSDFRDLYLWPIQGPIIMGSTQSIANDCKDYDEMVSRLLPIIEEASK